MKLVVLFCLIFTLETATVEHNYKSQAGQDDFVNRVFFHDKKGGFFLDIGAHDGVSGNNTYVFEKELGWKGICFEPLPHLFKQLQECRSCICINACVASTQGTLPFLHVDGCDEMLSGLCGTYDQRSLNAVMNDIANFGGELKILQLPTVRLDAVLAEHGITHIDFLSLDTEGSELEILETIDFSSLTIDVITVENNYNEPYIRELLTSKGFIFVTHLHVDDIYVRSDFAY